MSDPTLDRRNGDGELRERMVRLEVTQDGIKEDVTEIKAMFSEHSKQETLHMAKITEQITAIGESHTTFQADIKGRLWGMRAAWAAIVAVGAMVWKLIQDNTV